MRIAHTALLTCCAGLLAAGCRSREAEPRPRPPAAPVADRPAVLAELPEEAKPEAPAKGKASAKPRGKVEAAAVPAAPAAPAAEGGPHVPSYANVEFRFSERGGGVAWVMPEKDGKFRVFHNGRPGPAFDQIGQVALSADGLHCAYGGFLRGPERDRWRLVVDGEEGPIYDAIDYTTYSPDGRHLVYQAKVGDAFQLMVDGTHRRTARKDYVWQEFSADSSKLLFVEPVDDRTSRLVITDLAFQKQTTVDGPVMGAYVSGDKSRVAAVGVEQDGVRVLTFDFERPDRVRRGSRYDDVGGVEFGAGGFPLAYFALRGRERLLVVEEEEIPLGEGEQILGGAAPKPWKRGFGAMVRSASGAVTLRHFLTDPAPKEHEYEDAGGLVYGPDGASHAYVARRGTRWFLVANGKEGPPFDAVRPPAFSPDGRRLVYRARREGRRFVVIADGAANTLRELPPYEQVFEVRFTADGRSIAYGVKDGRQLAWKVEPLP